MLMCNNKNIVYLYLNRLYQFFKLCRLIVFSQMSQRKRKDRNPLLIKIQKNATFAFLFFLALLNWSIYGNGAI